jgi:hypothetical protein
MHPIADSHRHRRAASSQESDRNRQGKPPTTDEKRTGTLEVPEAPALSMCLGQQMLEPGLSPLRRDGALCRYFTNVRFVLVSRIHGSS